MSASSRAICLRSWPSTVVDGPALFSSIEAAGEEDMTSSATLESPAVCCWLVDVDGEAEDVPSSTSLDTSALFGLSTDFEEAVNMAFLRGREDFTCVAKGKDQDSCLVEELWKGIYA